MSFEEASKYVSLIETKFMLSVAGYIRDVYIIPYCIKNACLIFYDGIFPSLREPCLLPGNWFDSDDEDIGSNVEYSNANRTVTRKYQYDYDTVYGTIWMTPNKNKSYRYKIKIDNVNEYVWIGISDKIYNSPGNHSNIGSGAISCHASCAGMYLVLSDDCKDLKGCSINSGDTVELMLNFKDLSLVYSENDKFVYKDRVKSVPCLLTVDLGRNDA